MAPILAATHGASRSTHLGVEPRLWTLSQSDIECPCSQGLPAETVHHAVLCGWA